MLINYFSEILELITGAVKNIDSDHAYIHEGRLFTASHFVSLASGASQYIAFTTPNTDKVIHYRPATITTSADKLTFKFYETGTFTGGNALDAINRNRRTTTTAQAVLKSAVTSTLDGTLLFNGYLGGGTGVGTSRSGTETGEKNEWVLKKNTTYLFKLTNGSSTANEVNINFSWYEQEA